LFEYAKTNNFEMEAVRYWWASFDIESWPSFHVAIIL